MLTKETVLERLENNSSDVLRLLDWLLANQEILAIFAGGSIVREDYSSRSDIDLFVVYKDEGFSKVLNSFHTVVQKEFNTIFSYYEGYYNDFGHSFSFVMRNGARLDIGISNYRNHATLGPMVNNVFFKDLIGVAHTDLPGDYRTRNLSFYQSNSAAIADQWLFEFTKLLPEIEKRTFWTALYCFEKLRNQSFLVLRCREGIASPIVAKPEKNLQHELGDFLPSNNSLLPTNIEEIESSAVQIYCWLVDYIKATASTHNLGYLESLQASLSNYDSISN